MQDVSPPTVELNERFDRRVIPHRSFHIIVPSQCDE